MDEANTGANSHHSEGFGADNSGLPEDTRMPPEDREDAILRFFEEHGLPLPPKAIYRGLKIQKDITFSYRTVQNALARLNDDGYVMRCNKEALDEGRIEPIPESQNGRRTYYFITDKGRTRIR